MTDLPSLLARIEKAEGGDREIDGLIAQAFGMIPSDAFWSTQDVYGERPGSWVGGNFGAYVFYDPEEYTSSLDAGLSLVEKVLPGRRVGLRQHSDEEGNGWYAWLCSADYHVIQWTAGNVTKTDVQSGRRTSGDAPTPALALIAALLKAKIAEDAG